MEQGLISFLILSYRNIEGIIPTVRSVFEQDYPKIEIIISDDGSPNYEADIGKVRDFIEANRTENIRRVVYYHFEENQGTVKNANNACRLAQGEYIKDLGAEDTLAGPDVLSRYVRFLEESGKQICFARLQGVAPDGRIVKSLASCADDYTEYRKMTPLQVRDQLFVRNFLPAPAWFARKSLFEQYGYYDERIRLIEDYPYWIHLCTEGVSFGFMDDVMINYQLSGVSSTGSYGKAFMEDMYKIYENNIFPYDKRYGILQPVYNMLKKAGLNAYMDRAKWADYSFGQKALAWIRHGAFFAYIDYSNRRVDRKNEVLNGAG